jgi:hypothetical protein
VRGEVLRLGSDIGAVARAKTWNTVYAPKQSTSFGLDRVSRGGDMVRLQNGFECRGVGALLCAVIACILTSVLAHAQSQIDPQDIALAPSDLPPGFVVNVDKTKVAPFEGGGGVVYTLSMERPVTTENAASGPLWVEQLIGRFDGPVSYEGFLDQIRQRSISESGYQLAAGAPNDGGTASLVRFEGISAAYQVGFIKQNMVIFTTAVGNKDVVSLQSVLDLAGVSSARYDETLANGHPANTARVTPAQPGAPASGPVAQSEQVQATPTPLPPTPVPVPPTATPVVPAAAPQRTTAGAAALIDPSLRSVLQTLYSMKQDAGSGGTLGDVFRQIVGASGVTIQAGALPDGVLGAFVARKNTITIGSRLLREDVRSTASVLAHELTHVSQALRGADPVHECVPMEVDAHKIELIVWVNLYGGIAPGRTALERSENALAAAFATQGDPFLYELVVESPGYQNECNLWLP